MSPQDLLLQNIERYVRLTDATRHELLAITRLRRVKRRQFLIQPGFPAPYRNYVVEGMFRVYWLDDAGKEHTVSIGVEDWFVSDFYAYIHREPATLYVEALENGRVLQMHYDDIEPLINRTPVLSEYFRRTTERAFAYSRRRAITNISQSAEERYTRYLRMYPDIVRRVPQYVLASYLGMSAEFLSKIRARRRS